MLKRKQDSIDLAKKVEIIKEIEKKVKSNAQLAKDYNIPRSTLQTIFKNREKILEAFKSNKFGDQRKRLRLSDWPEVDEALDLWMRKVRDRNFAVSGPMLKAKAEEFALRLGHDDFKGSDGWLSGFKQRRQIVAKKINGESESADKTSCDLWLKETWPEIVKDYSPDNIFNVDETGLFWKQLPDRTLAFKNDKAKGEKKDKNRITVLVGANLSGNEKLPLLVIGKAAKPRCFKGMKTLPVDYRSNKKAWMTEVIFTKWIEDLDRKFSGHKRKVVILLVNCTAHPEIPDLHAIRLEFLPANTTSILQPMDQGIIRNLKVRYQKKVLNRILVCLDNDKQYELDLLKAICMVNTSWAEVEEKTIAGSFRKGRLFHCREEDAIVENDAIEPDRELIDLTEGLEILKAQGIDVLGDDDVSDFLEADSNLEVCAALSEKGIVSQILNSRNETIENVEEDCDSEASSDSTPTPTPTANEPQAAIELLQRYLMSLENSRECSQNLSAIELFINNAVFQNLKQSKISSFFFNLYKGK